MAIVLSNKCLQPEIMKIELSYKGEIKAGQFFMVRAWDKDPLLSRPLSVFDYDEGVLSFLYQVVGTGTKILSSLKAGDSLEIQGPYGNGFPEIKGDLCIVGGGIGIAPLYYLVKHFKKHNPQKKCRAYLGFRENPYCIEDFLVIVDDLITDVGGIIVDSVDAQKDETIISCGPEKMMKALCKKIPDQLPVFLSLEARMACGVGACLGCTCQTRSGNKKVCKDGPVFSREEVFNV